MPRPRSSNARADNGLQARQTSRRGHWRQSGEFGSMEGHPAGAPLPSSPSRLAEVILTKTPYSTKSYKIEPEGLPNCVYVADLAINFGWHALSPRRAWRP
jgi:hypothetical protein